MLGSLYPLPSLGQTLRLPAAPPGVIPAQAGFTAPLGVTSSLVRDADWARHPCRGGLKTAPYVRRLIAAALHCLHTQNPQALQLLFNGLAPRRRHIDPRRTHRPTSQPHQLHRRLEHSGVVKARAQTAPREPTAPATRSSAANPAVARPRKSSNSSCGAKLTKTSGKALNPSLEAKVQHARGRGACCRSRRSGRRAA